MAPRLPDRHPGGGEAGIRERPDGHGDQVVLRRKRVENRCAAAGAKVEAPRLAVVRDPHVLARPTLDPHPVALEPRLVAECTPGSALAGKAVTDGDANR